MIRLNDLKGLFQLWTILWFYYSVFPPNWYTDEGEKSMVILVMAWLLQSLPFFKGCQILTVSQKAQVDYPPVVSQHLCILSMLLCHVVDRIWCKIPMFYLYDTYFLNRKRDYSYSINIFHVWLKMFTAAYQGCPKILKTPAEISNCYLD